VAIDLTREKILPKPVIVQMNEKALRDIANFRGSWEETQQKENC
jgi:hypothetical protein